MPCLARAPIAYFPSITCTILAGSVQPKAFAFPDCLMEFAEKLFIEKCLVIAYFSKYKQKQTNKQPMVSVLKKVTVFLQDCNECEDIIIMLFCHPVNLISFSMNFSKILLPSKIRSVAWKISKYQHCQGSLAYWGSKDRKDISI